MAELREQLTNRQELIGKFLLEFVIIFIGVTAAFALEAVRQAREMKAKVEALL